MWGHARQRKKIDGGTFSQLAENASGADPAFPSLSFPSLSFPSAASIHPSESSPPSLRDTVKNRLFNDMIRGFAEPAGAVLCVDRFTMRVISSVCKLSELLDENIHVVENITMRQQNGDYLRRQHLPNLAAVYFITPTVESVNRLISDFRDKKNPMYRCCHLYFSSRLGDALLNKLKASVAIHKVIGFKELNLELVCTEPNVFTFDSPQSLPVLFAPEESPASTEAKLQEQHRLAAMIATLCATLGEMPIVRHAARPVATSVATVLQTKLAEMSRPGSSFPSRILTDADRPTLLIVDRSSDPLSPLLHEFTYQAMAHDLLPIHDDRHRYQYIGNNNQKLSKEVLLNDTDPIWTRLRHLHIADLGPLLHTEYKQFLLDHPEAAQLSKACDKGIKTMAEGLRGMPKFQEISSRYSLHMALTQELMTKYNVNGLEAIATLEQNMATGEDSTGKTHRTALADLRALLERTDLNFSPEDKMRLLMIYVTTQDGIKQDERRQLLNLAGISPEDQVAILNLFYLNVTLLQGMVAKKKSYAKKAERIAEAAYDVSRYTPPIKRHLEELLTSGLPVNDFPFVETPESFVTGAREATFCETKAKSKGKCISGSNGTEVALSGKRCIVIVLGGLAYSELRALHEVARSHGRELIIGTTAMLTPQAYLLALKQMKGLEEPRAV